MMDSRSTHPQPHTISPAALHTIDPAAMDITPPPNNRDADAAQKRGDGGTPVNHCSPRNRGAWFSDSVLGHSAGSLAPFCATITDDKSKDEERHVDMTYGRDQMYMLNSDVGSFSRTLKAESDPAVQALIPHQALEAIAHLIRARYLAEQDHLLVEQAGHGDEHHHRPETPVAMGNETIALSSWEASKGHGVQARWHPESFLTNTLRQVKQKLGKGAALITEFRKSGDAQQACAYLDCPEFDHQIKDDSYYLALWDGSEDAVELKLFCLRCFEDLWEGIGLPEQVPAENIGKPLETVPTTPSFSLDGADADNVSNDNIKEPQLVRVFKAPTIMAFGIDGATDDQVPITVDTYRPRTPPSSDELIETPPLRHAVRSVPRVGGKSFAQVLNLPLHSKSGTPPVSPYARELVRTFGRKLLAKQAITKTSSPVRPGPQSGARRSTRLQLDIVPGSSPSPVATTPTNNSSTRTSKVGIGALMGMPKQIKSNTDTLSHKIAKTTRRFEHMYAQRAEAVMNLSPGSKIKIRPKYARLGGQKCIVSMDVFGIIYTDLLAEPVRYQCTPIVSDLESDTVEGVQRAVSTKAPTSSTKEQPQKEKTKDLWCSCYGPDDGKQMILCASEKCLVGWYHARCIDGDDIDDGKHSSCLICDTSANRGFADDWHCRLCSPTQPADTLHFTPLEIHRLFPPV